MKPVATHWLAQDDKQALIVYQALLNLGATVTGFTDHGREGVLVWAHHDPKIPPKAILREIDNIADNYEVATGEMNIGDEDEEEDGSPPVLHS